MEQRSIPALHLDAALLQPHLDAAVALDRKPLIAAVPEDARRAALRDQPIKLAIGTAAAEDKRSAEVGEATATVELMPGGGARRMPSAIATNHQHGRAAAECSAFTRSEERREHLEKLFSHEIAPDALGDLFLEEPLFQRNYAAGFGTLFTAVYDPKACGLTLRWPGHSWSQRLDAFREGRREIRYLDDLRPVAARESGALADVTEGLEALRPFLPPARMQAFDRWVHGARTHSPDWASFGEIFSG